MSLKICMYIITENKRQCQHSNDNINVLTGCTIAFVEMSVVSAMEWTP